MSTGRGERARGRGGRPALIAIAAGAASVIVAGFLGVTSAVGHEERPAFFPDPAVGSVPQYRTTGPSKIVCKSDSKQRIQKNVKGQAARQRNLALLKQCSFDHIQAAVNAASNGDRILVLPGVYREEPSQAPPGPECEDGEGAESYEFQRNCPNTQNLIGIIGDADPNDEDRRCDDKCNLQIEGTGDSRDDVLITGGPTRSKLNVIRADRADGIYLKNFTIEFSDFNNIYALETNGFRFDDIESRFSREYGFLSFTSDNGLYENLEAFGSGDSGVYPGSGPEGHCQRYGIEIRNVNSHDNTIGYSGTAGNGVWAHDNKFHHNSTGMTTDSFASGHPGMPQDCAKWEDNEIYSNNGDLFGNGNEFGAERDAYCQQTPPAERDPRKVCPTFQVPVGTGILIAGGNGNIVRDNFIYDNWRDGSKLFWVPANLRGEEDPAKQIDTSFNNRYLDNVMGVRPDGTADLNGNDFWWDEEGAGNCWSNNTGPGGAAATHNVPTGLPACTDPPAECATSPEPQPPPCVFSPGNPEKSASQAPCATWNPQDNTDPPGCDWFEVPPEPKP